MFKAIATTIKQISIIFCLYCPTVIVYKQILRSFRAFSFFFLYTSNLFANATVLFTLEIWNRAFGRCGFPFVILILAQDAVKRTLCTYKSRFFTNICAKTWTTPFTASISLPVYRWTRIASERDGKSNHGGHCFNNTRVWGGWERSSSGTRRARDGTLDGT